LGIVYIAQSIECTKPKCIAKMSMRMRFAIMAGIATINKPIWFEISEQSSHLDFKGVLNAPFKLSPPIILHDYSNIKHGSCMERNGNIWYHFKWKWRKLEFPYKTYCSLPQSADGMRSRPRSATFLEIEVGN